MINEIGQKPENIKRLGLFILIILCIIRFVFVPLSDSLDKKKKLFDDKRFSYRLKADLHKRYESKVLATKGGDRGEPAREPLFFPVGSKDTTIQTDILTFITNRAKDKGLSYDNFEILDSREDTTMIEIAIIIRLRGKMYLFLELLKEISRHKPVLKIKELDITRRGNDYHVHMRVAGYIDK